MMGPVNRPTRLVTPDDASALADLVHDNRGFLAPYEPFRDDAYYTVDGQRAVIDAALHESSQGRSLPHVVLDDTGRVVGRVTLSTIVRGPFQSCSVGYWLAREATGRGLATAAVREIQRVAFDELGLHRVEAATLVHNTASQRVLQRNGFTRFGLAPKYLRIAGKWQDHLVFQALNPGAG
jgi:ribosomal-protein-alanine N-acetyltransferase